jgi:SAM-dependent methyltransferase
MADDDSLARRKSYQNSFAEHGESPLALQWSNYKAVAIRYQQLVADLHFENKSILDAGCGMGDVLPYIYSKSTNFSYLGVDITPEFIEIARKRYVGDTFEVLNPFDSEVVQKYDIVICSGVMNMKTPGWETRRKAMIERLFSYANEALVFNMAGWMRESSEGKTIGYANIPDVLDFCSSLTHKIILRNQYSAKDFTVVMYKQTVPSD